VEIVIIVIFFSEKHPGYVLSYITGGYGWYLNTIQFHWVREEVQYIMSSLKYDLDHVQNVNLGEPKAVHSTMLMNESPIDQKKIYTYSYSTTDTDQWSLSAAYTAGVSVSVTAGVPKIAEVGVTVSASTTFGFSYGKQTSIQSTHSHTLEAIVPGNSKMPASILVFGGKVEVPYTTELTIVYADGTRVTKQGERGTFTGIQAGKSISKYGKPTKL